MTLQDGLTPTSYASDNGVGLNPTCGLPSSTTLQMPSMSATVASNAPPSAGQQGLTIHDLNQRLPSIVQSAPIVMSADAGCTGVEKWVADNPVMAGLGLIGLAIFLFGRK